ncbi:MAG TPA: hypothetical protein VFX37_02925 [Pseudolabrys sp.]|nr:hypothetical protein [Pseudolabrys sp.]
MALNGFSLASAFDAAATPLALPVWLAGAVAAVLFFLCILALRRAGTLSALLWIVVGGIGAISGLMLLGSSVPQRRGAESGLEARNAELTARALVPGSVLSCLGGAAGDAIESACERKIFASPEQVAAAVVFVTAQLSLLADVTSADRGDAHLAAVRANLERAIGLDRYGIAAHVLATRDGCTAERCPVFALLEDAAALKTNLKTHAFDNYVTRYAAAWGKPVENGRAPVAELSPPTPTAANPLPEPHAPVPSKYDFPSADSIPPVSIMNAEPKLAAPSESKNAGPSAPVTSGSAAAPKPAPALQEAAKLPLPPHRPQTQAATPAPR